MIYCSSKSYGMCRIDKFLNQQVLHDMVQALMNEDHFQYDKDGLQIDAKTFGNGYTFNMRYDSNDEVSKIRADFDKFLLEVDELDDSLFIEVCESLDLGLPGKLKQLDNMLKSDDPMTVTSAVKYFKDKMLLVAQEKYKVLSKELDENA